MKLHKWNVLSDNKVIKTVHTSKKDRDIAVAKFKHAFGDLTAFCQLKYVGIEEV